MNPVVKLARQQILRILDGGTVQVPTSVGLLEVSAKADDRWQPLRQIPVPEHIKAQRVKGPGVVPDELWRNDTYEVFVYRTEEGGAHLSIKRYDRAPIRNWRHFQQMKNEIAGPEIEALELFPRESRLADNANQYHLFCLPPNLEIPVGFPGGFVTIEDADVEAYNTAGGRGRQEPMQDGLTVGQTMQEVQTREGINAEQAAARAQSIADNGPRR